MLLQQNISCVRYLFCIWANSIILKASISVGVKRLGEGWGMFSSFAAEAWSPCTSWSLHPCWSLWVLPSSALSSLTKHRCHHCWRRGPCLVNPDRKQLETRTEDNCVIHESKPPGDYIMNFYRLKYVSCKKMESREHTRYPRGRGRAQGGRARPPWRKYALEAIIKLLFISLFHDKCLLFMLELY